MLTMAVLPNFNAIVKPSPYPSSILSIKPSKFSTFATNPLPFSSPSFSLFSNKNRNFCTSVSSAETVPDVSFDVDDIPSIDANTETLKVVPKSTDKPRLVLKFIWMEKNIGLALDQTVPGHGTIPLSPYYFWPRKDAWEELKVLLESKPWISQKQMIILLNQATDIINLWQQSGGNLAS
ncbi:small ribosomal subunit protein cS23-like [Silene latifolia]|uniref:small ribosomal subunit protein cS23-like n=1 Tax=Silene latifolia TaxID=37657 RepID=UPI003D785528